MRRTRENVLEWLLVGFIGLLLLATVWMIAASVVFAFRHPWMTETERLLHLPQALMFQTVEYKEARPRENEP